MKKTPYVEQQLHELLYQALETERGGIKIYQTALSCAKNQDLTKEWQAYLEQTCSHEQQLLTVFKQLGLDPDTTTAGRDVVTHIADSLLSAMELALSNADAAAAQAAADSQAASDAAAAQAAAEAQAAADAAAAQAAADAAAAQAALDAQAAADAALVLRAVQPTWVQAVDGSGQTLMARLVPAGETVALTPALPVRLRIGNAQGTELQFRGQPVDLSAAARDNIANITLP